MNVIHLFHSIDVQRIIANAQQEIIKVTGQDVTIEVRPAKEDTIDTTDIINMFCAVWGIEPGELKRKCRKREYVIMRQILSMRLKMTGLALEKIGDLFGGRDHTSIIHALQSAKDRLDTKDALFFQYFNPVQHLFNILNQKAIA